MNRFRKSGKKKKKSLAFKNGVAGYLFIAPFIIGFIAFMAIPLFQSFFMTWNDVTPEIGGFALKWSGLSNIDYAFNVNPDYRRFLFEELIRMLYSLPATLIFSFFIALLLNQKFKGRGLVRAVFFLPVILSSGVVLGIEFNNQLFQEVQEAVAEASSEVGITTALREILVDNGGFASDIFLYVFDIVEGVYAIAIASGIQIIIFLSGLQTISPSMFEAAQIEGCTAWESFWKITFPMVSSLVLVNIVYTVVDFFSRTDNTVAEEVQKAVGKLEYGQASAMAWIYFLIVIVFLGIISLIISKRIYYYE